MGKRKAAPEPATPVPAAEIVAAEADKFIQFLEARCIGELTRVEMVKLAPGRWDVQTHAKGTELYR